MSDHRPALISAVVYKDPRAALDWLQKAFGFEIDMLIEGPDGELMHSEMRFEDSLVMVGNEWTVEHRSPASMGGLMTQTIHIHVKTDIDAHCERARQAGAVIVAAPETQFYGDRTYRCKDLEGHIWTVGQTVQTMTPKEWDAVAGVVTTMRS
ncbi:VOC family protein [Caulobacter sp. NIBR2454]|uniref:VOC family protein n=1 Tax=Caulobacter sp. NIBR2454 TaxID=3015996 RepID=UPI0022B74930|nr:VOC family protein [Caulobacter sp. NIBR2454]